MNLLQKFKHYLYYSYSKKKYKSEEQNQRQFINYSKVENCLLVIVANGVDDLIQIQDIANILTQDKKDFTICCYVRNKKIEMPSYDKKHIFFNTKNISWSGKPKIDVINKIKKQKYSIVFDITQNSYIPLLYVIDEVSATMSCGTSGNDVYRHDLKIDISNFNTITGIDILRQFIHYLKTINTR
ncbi:MAG: hypothetical protein CSA89_00710 [Bacteroidales bacterium]|nr:MAG: hypothetical protein CSA89_00710 [Bacteroidales bacterium]